MAGTLVHNTARASYFEETRLRVHIVLRAIKTRMERLSLARTGTRCCQVLALCILVAASGLTQKTALAANDMDGLDTGKVRAEIQAFFDVFLGRPLTESENRQAASEFMTIYGAPTCEAQCRAALAVIRQRTDFLKSSPGIPESLALRHAMMSGNYFNPKLQNTLILRLLAEPDPVIHADQASQRLMLRSDLIGSLNLQIFLQSGFAVPIQPPPFSREDMEQATAIFADAFTSNDITPELPPFFAIAAELWEAIRLDWLKLNSSDRQLVKNYIALKSLRPLPARLYERLIGLSTDDARQLETIEQLIKFKSEFYSDVSKQLELLGRKAVNDHISSIFLTPRP